MSRAYVLLSGGVDSSTCLAHAYHTFGGSVCAVSVSYGQRHSNEIEYAKKVASHFGAPHKTLDLSTIMGKGGLTDPTLDIPKVDYNDLGEGVSPTFVPFRNGLMLSALTSMAVADDEAEAVYHGAHAEDAAGWAYPDCTPEFIGGMANAIYVGTYHRVRLMAPLIHLRKWEVVALGDRLGVPWADTWSCYEGGQHHCGICPTCRSRRMAFYDAEVVDPTTYLETDPEAPYANAA